MSTYSEDLVLNRNHIDVVRRLNKYKQDWAVLRNTDHEIVFYNTFSKLVFGTVMIDFQVRITFLISDFTQPFTLNTPLTLTIKSPLFGDMILVENFTYEWFMDEMQEYSIKLEPTVGVYQIKAKGASEPYRCVTSTISRDILLFKNY